MENDPYNLNHNTYNNTCIIEIEDLKNYPVIPSALENNNNINNNNEEQKDHHVGGMDPDSKSTTGSTRDFEKKSNNSNHVISFFSEHL